MAAARTLDGQQKTRLAAAKGKLALDRREAEKSGPVRVRGVVLHGEGKAVGYYGVRRIREGQIFTIKSMAEFSPRWMQRVDKAGRPLDDGGKPLPEETEADLDTGDPTGEKAGSSEEDVI